LVGLELSYQGISHLYLKNFAAFFEQLRLLAVVCRWFEHGLVLYQKISEEVLAENCLLDVYRKLE